MSVTVNQHTEGRQAGEQAAPDHFQLKVKDQQGSDLEVHAVAEAHGR